MAGTLTRRQALAAGAVGAVAALAGGAGLVQAGVLPGRYRAGRSSGRATSAAPRPPPFWQQVAPASSASWPTPWRPPGRGVTKGTAGR